jgi:hypothetical protein
MKQLKLTTEELALLAAATDAGIEDLRKRITPAQSEDVKQFILGQIQKLISVRKKINQTQVQQDRTK